jgi:hypothetical protein
MVFGTLAAVKQALAPLGWHINTAFIERASLTYASMWQRSGDV